jgi:hypothetical protein
MRLSILIAGMLLASVVYADKTNFGVISQINYNATIDHLFFLTEERWQVRDANGNVQCEPIYVQVTASVPGRDKMLSIGLAARYAQSQVKFQGNCASNPEYFNATYIITR